MNEFLTGNFSRVGEIIQQFRNYITKNISEIEKEVLEGFDTYDTYIENKKSQAYVQRDDLLKKREQLLEDDKTNNHCFKRTIIFHFF